MSVRAPARSVRAKTSPDGKGLDRKTAAAINEELRKKFGLTD